MTEDRFLGELAVVTAMHPPSVVAADGTGCVRLCRRDTESQIVVGEVGRGPDDCRSESLAQAQTGATSASRRDETSKPTERM